MLFVNPWVQVPKDLLVAHAEKRVLQGALDQAAQKAADAEVKALLTGLCALGALAVLRCRHWGFLGVLWPLLGPRFKYLAHSG